MIQITEKTAPGLAKWVLKDAKSVELIKKIGKNEYIPIRHNTFSQIEPKVAMERRQQAANKILEIAKSPEKDGATFVVIG